jgi:tetratricopeptide (TPR) repeat protein
VTWRHCQSVVTAERLSTMAISTRHRWLNGLLAGTLCVMAACVVQQASVLMVADWTASLARQDIVKWSSKKADHTPEQWENARRALEAASARLPQDATLHDALAQLHSLRGQQLWTTGAVDSPEVAAYAAAIVHQKTSLRVRPTHAMAWANLALMQYAVYEETDTLFASWREAARLGPREDDVIETLVYVATEMWSVAPDDVRAWVEVRRPGLSAQLDAKQAAQ